MRRRRPPDPSTLSGIVKSLVKMDVEEIEVAIDDQGQFSAKKQ
jgi:hypothetical protein